MESLRNSLNSSGFSLVNRLSIFTLSFPVISLFQIHIVSRNGFPHSKLSVSNLDNYLSVRCRNYGGYVINSFKR